MKKVLTVLLVLVLVAGIVGTNVYYIEKIDSITGENTDVMSVLHLDYNEIVEENEALESELEDLYENIYKMQNNEAYEISVDYNGEHHTWKSDGGFLTRVRHSVIK